MEVLYIFLGVLALIGASVGIVLYLDKDRCQHDWNLIEKGKKYQWVNGHRLEKGIYKFYECEHCKKMKKEVVDID